MRPSRPAGFAVVSLPAGVFNPYSNVKTSILFFDNSLAKKTDSILFVRVLNDGFDLGAQRRPRPDLPNDLVCDGGALDVLVGQLAQGKGSHRRCCSGTVVIFWDLALSREELDCWEAYDSALINSDNI